MSAFYLRRSNRRSITTAWSGDDNDDDDGDHVQKVIETAKLEQNHLNKSSR